MPPASKMSIRLLVKAKIPLRQGIGRAEQVVYFLSPSLALYAPPPPHLAPVHRIPGEQEKGVTDLNPHSCMYVFAIPIPR